MEINFKLVLLVLIGIVLIMTQSVEGFKCDRTPEGSTAIKSPADGRFLIRISGNPQRYVAGERYTSKCIICKLLNSTHNSLFIVFKTNLIINMFKRT